MCITERGKPMDATRRRHAVLALLVRVLTLLLAVQMSGVGPALWGDCCSTDGDDCSGQTDRSPCGDCPPACPKCHCAQAPFSVPPSIETGRLDLDLGARRVVWAGYAAEAPKEAPLSSIFRPPRLA